MTVLESERDRAGSDAWQGHAGGKTAAYEAEKEALAAEGISKGLLRAFESARGEEVALRVRIDALENALHPNAPRAVMGRAALEILAEATNARISRLEALARRDGRRLKLLHLGNVAGNAYVAATILNERGHINHVAAPDLYHFASTSEWHDLRREDVDRAALGDDWFPNFWCLGARRPPSPRWFANGPMARVLVYLDLLNSGTPSQIAVAWACLQYARFRTVAARDAHARQLPLNEGAFEALLAAHTLSATDEDLFRYARRFETIEEHLREVMGRLYDAPTVAGLHLPFEAAYIDSFAALDPPLARAIHDLRREGLAEASGIQAPASWASAPPLPPGIGAEDAAPYTVRLGAFARLFSHYDAVIGYAADTIWPYLADARPYLGYECGTIRSIPFEPTANGRLVAASYLAADRVLLTNTDYLIASPRLPIAAERLVQAPHAFDERPLADFARVRGRRRLQDDGNVNFFSPTRQDWVNVKPAMSKANDRFIHALALLRGDGVTNLRVEFVDWGPDADATRALIEELEVGDLVTWCPPLSKRLLWGRYLDAHAVVDQFVIPSISGVSFEALALGARVITCDDPRTNAVYFGEAPPLLAASTAPEIAARLRAVIADPDDVAGIGAAGQSWIARHHSAARFAELVEDALGGVLAERRQP